jgi:hypothetical protein
MHSPLKSLPTSLPFLPLFLSSSPTTTSFRFTIRLGCGKGSLGFDLGRISSFLSASQEARIQIKLHISSTHHFVVPSCHPRSDNMSSRADPRVYANMSSPAEGAADSIQGTPNTQITVFSPAESSQETSIQGNNYVAQSQAPEDPFVDRQVAQVSTLSATASTFQPRGVRSKGKNAAVFYPEGSPTIAGALSQDMDISHRIEVCDTPAPSIIELGNFITVSITWSLK